MFGGICGTLSSYLQRLTGIFTYLSSNHLCEINQIYNLHRESFSEYQYCYSGKDVVVVGAGPTINYYNPISDAIHIGLNNTYKLKDKINFDFMFAQDYAGGESRLMIENIAQMECTKFFGITYGDSMNRILIPEGLSAGSRRYFFTPHLYKKIHPDVRYYPLMDFNSVVFPAIHFALFTNPKRLYLAGCDTSTYGHFDSKEVKILQDNVNIMKTGYQRVKEFANKHYPDTEIISINPVGLKGLFIDEYTDDYLNSVE